MENEKSKIKTVLQEYPEVIRKVEEELFTMRLALAQAETNMQRIEARINFDVLEDSGKPGYEKELSNAAKRDKEAVSRLGRNEEYLNTKDIVRKLREDVGKLQIQCDYSKRCFKAACVMGEMEK
jgi:hypothetical protein